MTTFHTTPWQFSSCNTTNLYLVACQFSILYHGKFYLVTWQFFILQHDKSLSCSMAILHFHCTMTIFSDSMPITDRWHELSYMMQHCNPYTHHNMAIFPLITLPQHGNFYLIQHGEGLVVAFAGSGFLRERICSLARATQSKLIHSGYPPRGT